MTKKLYLNKLDAIRGFLSIYVFLTHFVLEINIPNYIKLFFAFGQEAVIGFFILSGFVMYLSMQRHPNLTFKSYFIRRFRRIYFPLVIAMLVSILIVYFNRTLHKRFSWLELIGSLAMLQDFSEVKPGTWFNPFLSNLPLWSLSYEWWFYIIFYPVYHLLPARYQKAYFILPFCIFFYISYVVVPNHACLILSYFIVWWSGVEAASIFMQQGQLTYKNMQHVIFSLFLMSVVTAIPVIGANEIRFGYYPFLVFRHLFMALTLVILGLWWYQNGLANFNKIFGRFSKIAPISYSLYVLQYPILIRWDLSSYIANLWVILAIKVALIFALSYLLEVKLQPIVNRLIR